MRLHTVGFEQGAILRNSEYADSVRCEIQSIVKRSGNYALRSNDVDGSNLLIYTKGELISNNVTYVRAYFNLASVGDENGTILQIREEYNYGAEFIGFHIHPNRRIYIQNEISAYSAQTDPIEFNRWYRLELKVDATTLSATVIEAKIDGVVLGGTTVDMSEVGFAPQAVVIGDLGGGGQAWDMFFDDVAINDGDGSFDNTYPGEGKIITLHPTSTVTHGFSKIHNDPGDNNNHTLVDEIYPDDMTTVIKTLSIDTEDEYKFENVPIGDNDSIKLLQGYVRCASDGVDTAPTLYMYIDSAAGDVCSPVIDGLSSVWKTNGDMEVVPKSMVIYEYNTGVPITKNQLINGDIMAGIYTNDSGDGFAYVSTFALNLEYTEGIVPPSSDVISPDKKMPNGYTCFIKQFVKNSLSGNVPPITPDGVNRAW